jgi:hypothetical protein
MKNGSYLQIAENVADALDVEVTSTQCPRFAIVHASSDEGDVSV